jgi:heme A synthase
MKSLGSLVVAILVGILALWLLVKLVFFALKLAGIAIAIALAVAAYFAVERMIRGNGRAR